MTIAELVENLKEFPPSTPVMVESKTDGGYAAGIDWVVNFGGKDPVFAVIITDFPVPTNRRDPSGC